MTTNCSSALLGIFTKKPDPCPAKSKGSFKVANVCKFHPYVYYTPRGSVKNFKDSIDDVLLVERFDPGVKRFYMSVKCVLPNGVPGKGTERSVVVEKLTPLETIIKTRPDINLIAMYSDFVTEFLTEVMKFAREDIWELLTTDLKPDNLMYSEREGRLKFTDFSPIRKTDKGTSSIVSTPTFSILDNFSDYSSHKKYTDLQLSNFGLNLFLITAMTSLIYINAAVNAWKSTKVSNINDFGWTSLDNVLDSAVSILDPRSTSTDDMISFLLDEVDSAVSRNLQLVCSNWVSTTRGKAKGKAVMASAPSKGVIVRSKSKAPSSGDKCREFMKEVKGTDPKVKNPFTGRMVERDGQAFKKLVAKCGGRASQAQSQAKKAPSRGVIVRSKSKAPSSGDKCREFMKEVKGTDPKVKNPFTGRMVERDGQAFKKLVAKCGGRASQAQPQAKKPTSSGSSGKGSVLSNACREFINDIKGMKKTFLINPFTGRKIRVLNHYPTRYTPLAVKVHGQCWTKVNVK
jgi:serine/threonine protein kinase